MSFFNLFSKIKTTKKPKFNITELDRQWVEDGFDWLIKVYGYPSSVQVLFTQEDFPKTFSTKEIKIEHLIEDLCAKLDLTPNLIHFELQTDVRDSNIVPYQMEGNEFEADTEILEFGYKIHIANSLSKRPNRLLYSLIFEMVKIRLIESNLKFDTGEDSDLFLYLAGIYLGLGVILTENLVDVGRTTDGFWESKWHSISQMPKEVMVFGLAIYSKLQFEENQEWISKLSDSLSKHLNEGREYLDEYPSYLCIKEEIESRQLYMKAHGYYLNRKFDEAILTAEQILTLTKDEILIPEIYNNIGYYYLRKGEYSNAIINFKKALKVFPDYGFALDNLGYSLIKLGEFEDGKLCLDQAKLTENNDLAYSYRNDAMYYVGIKDFEKAESFFQLAFQEVSVPVDLLEFNYAEFLFAKGDLEKGMEYLKMSVDAKEPEGERLMEEMNNK